MFKLKLIDNFIIVGEQEIIDSSNIRDECELFNSFIVVLFGHRSKIKTFETSRMHILKPQSMSY